MYSIIKLLLFLNELIVCVNGAYLTSSNHRWLIKAKQIERKSEISNDRNNIAYAPISLKPPSGSFDSINSSPRAYTPSKKIPIPSTKLDKSKKPSLEATSSIYADNDDDDCYDSSSETSSSNSSSLENLEFFQMSFEPTYSAIQNLISEEKKLERKLEKDAESVLISQKESKDESSVPDYCVYYLEDEIEPDLEDYSKKRREHYITKYEHNLSLNCNDEDIENDSDFGSNTKKECYSLSF